MVSTPVTSTMANRDFVCTMAAKSFSVMRLARALSTVLTIGTARTPSQSWMMGVESWKIA